MASENSRISRIRNTREETKALYDRLSRWYDLGAGIEKKCRRAGLRMLDVKRGEVVLEVGFGTGHCILALAESVGGSGKVYGVDISEGMLRIAESRVKKRGLSDTVELKLGDAAGLPFRDGVFDAVFMSFTLELFDTPEIPLVLGECRRTLREGGRICVVAMSRKKTTAVTKLYEQLHGKFPAFFDCRPIFVEETLKDAGFRILERKEMSLLGMLVETVVAAK